MNYTKQLLAMGSAAGVDKLIEAVEHAKLDDVLGVIGLERKPSDLAKLLPLAGLITISAAVGAGIALLLAPSSGTRLRARLSDGLDEAKHQLSDRISDYEMNRQHRHAVS